MTNIYYWQAANRIVAIDCCGRMINILSEGEYGVKYFTVERSRSRVAKIKTLVYLGAL